MFGLDSHWLEIHIHVRCKFLLITSYFLVHMQKTFIECLLLSWHCPRHFYRPFILILILTTAL